jgi:DNA-binding NarL/FixJ family response regulator
MGPLNQWWNMDPISLLLVDDNPRFLQLLTRFLHIRYPADVVVMDVARSGVEAVARAQIVRPQVVLLDLAMPDMPGWEVIPRLRKELPEVGIIVLTLLESGGYRDMVLEAGADAFVGKSTLVTELMPAIRRVATMRLQWSSGGEPKPVLSKKQVGGVEERHGRSGVGHRR